MELTSRTWQDHIMTNVSWEGKICLLSSDEHCPQLIKRREGLYSANQSQNIT
jgi:hypothetical protein